MLGMCLRAWAGECAAERARKSAWARQRGGSLGGMKEQNADLEAGGRMW
jgi:hypothetical protein